MIIKLKKIINLIFCYNGNLAQNKGLKKRKQLKREHHFYTRNINQLAVFGDSRKDVGKRFNDRTIRET